MDFNVEELLAGILGKGSGNKKIATPSQDAIAGLLGGLTQAKDGDVNAVRGVALDAPMSERTPIGGSSAMLPPSFRAAMDNGVARLSPNAPTAEESAPDVDTAPESQETPIASPSPLSVPVSVSDLQTDTGVNTSGTQQQMASPDAQALLDRIQSPQQVTTTAPTQSGQVQPRPMDMPVSQPSSPDNSTLLYQTPSGQKFTVQQNNNPAPSDEETYLRGKVADAQSYRPSHGWGKVADVGFGALQGLNKGVQQAVYGVRDNSPTMTLDQVRQQRETAKYAPRLNQIEMDKAQKTAQDVADQNRRYKEEQIKNIPFDNETQRLDLERKRQEAEQRRSGIALGRLTKLKYFDPNRPEHAQLAKEAGLDPADLQGFDDRDPIIKKVGDTSYKLNRATGEFEPSNLPKDEEKTLTTYTVKMPTGEERTFKVAQKDAARFATQWNVLGAQIEAANNRQDKSIANDQAKQQALNAYRGAMVDIAKQKTDLASKGDTKGAAALQIKHDALKARLLERVREGKLSQEEFDNIFAQDAGFGTATGGVEKP